MKAKSTSKKPIAVLISDVHYNITTIALADEAMRQAINLANGLSIPLIVAGDLHDTKANMRAECVNAMIETFSLRPTRETWILRGNHDAINEKSERHALSFLKPFAQIVEKPRLNLSLDEERYFYFIPYHHNPEELRTYLKTIPKGSTLIMHQGISGSKSGEYIQDHSAIRSEDVAGMRVISGHYHTRQTIDLPDGGKWDYIGNPYTLNFGEANDRPKGFQVLHDDGSLEFIPTNLRKHVVIEVDATEEGFSDRTHMAQPIDLVWIKLHGPKELLSKYNKERISKETGLSNFRLDLIPLDQETKPELSQTITLTQTEQFDQLIDSLTNTSVETKERIKSMWKVL